MLGSEKVLFDYITAHTKESKEMFDTDSELCKKIGVSCSSLRLYRKKLEKLGLIETKSCWRNKQKGIAYMVKGE